MKKRNYLFLALALILIVCSFVLVSCDEETPAASTAPHEHTYEDAWSSDADSHWHAALCEHTDEKSGLAAHTWDEGEETIPPTEYDDGVMTYTCTVCGKTKTERIPKLVANIAYSP